MTTGGEKASWGKNAGSWTLLKQHICKGISTAWCFSHHTDLALESVHCELLELCICMTDVLALSKFLSSSTRRTKLLVKEDDHVLAFRCQYVVRFAEHTLNLLTVLNNLEAARKLCAKMTDGTQGLDRREKYHQMHFLTSGVKACSRYG